MGSSFPHVIPVDNPGQRSSIPCSLAEKGFRPEGDAGSVKGMLKEDDLIRMKFLDAHARLIIDQIELMFAPVSIPVFVAPSVPGVHHCTHTPYMEHKEHEGDGVCRSQ